MTKQEAKDWCIKKWEWIVDWWVYCYQHDNFSILYEEYPELITFKASCAYCEKYKHVEIECAECPLAKLKYGHCPDDNSYYSRWNGNDEKTHKYAVKLLDLIKRS